MWSVKCYEIKNLQVTNSDDVFPAHFKITSMSEDVHIILGLTWIETLGIFILNLKNKYRGSTRGCHTQNNQVSQNRER